MLVSAIAIDPSTIRITAISDISGSQSTMDINMEADNFKTALDKWRNDGLMVQEAFPNLSAGEREFLMSGISPDDDDEDDEDDED